MKLLGFLFFLLSSFSAEAGLSCDEAAKRMLPPEQIASLAESVCGHFMGRKPNHYHDIAEALIYEYTLHCFQKINNALRQGSDGDASAALLGKQLDALLCNYPPYEGLVYRGTRLPESVLAQYLKSEEIELPGFSSATLNPTVACNFSKNTYFMIQSKSSVPIWDFSKVSHEEEVLFRIDAQFRVKSVVTGAEAVYLISGCRGPSYLFELEEI